MSIWSAVLATITIDRFDEPKAVATAAVYLASDATANVTDEVHVADGGIAAQRWHALVPRPLRGGDGWLRSAELSLAIARPIPECPVYSGVTNSDSPTV